jgi:hypothetical protein
MVRRKDKIIQPRGATCIQSGDGVTIMGDHKVLADFAAVHFPDQYSELGGSSDKESRLTLNELLKLSPRRRNEKSK